MQVMNLLVPLFIITALVVTNISIKPSSPKDNVLGTSESISPTVSINSTSTPTTTPMNTSKVLEDSQVNIEITHTPNNSTSQNIVYPNSNSIGGGNYESSDSPQSITDWYKNVIKDKNMNTTSVVSTNTNDNIKNVLAADNGAEKLHVEITKNSGDSKTIIKLN